MHLSIILEIQVQILAKAKLFSYSVCVAIELKYIGCSQTDRFFLKIKKSRRNVVCGLVARCLRLVKSEEIEIESVDPKKIKIFNIFVFFEEKLDFLKLEISLLSSL
jgi:hypothetical protein